MDKYTVAYFILLEPCPEIKINDIQIPITSMKSKNIFLSKRSLMQKSTYCMMPLLWHSTRDKIIYSDRKRICGFLGLEDSFTRCIRENFRVMEMSYCDFSTDYMEVYIFQTLWTAHVK